MMRCIRYPAHFDTYVYDAKAFFNLLNPKMIDSILSSELDSTLANLTSRTTVMDTSRSLAENLKLTGPNLVSYPDVLEKVVDIVMALITKNHTCQEELSLEAEADLSDIETTEFDWLVVDSAMDVISGLAVALGPDFTPLWKKFDKHILKYASAGESLERATAVGVLAEVITGMGGSVTPYTAQLGQILLKRLSDEDPQTKSNAAYAVGRLVEKSDDTATVAKAFPPILSKVHNLLSIKEGRCQDNAAGCISRLILKHREAVPTDEILPELVESGILPLKEDYEENEPVWQMIVQMYKWEDPTIISLTPKLVPAIKAVLGEPENQLNDETREQVQQLALFLQQNMSS
jgi:importin-4